MKTFLATIAVGIALQSISEAAIVARWTFDETSGNIVHDSAGSLNGTLSPQGSAFVAGGVAGNALSLNRALNGFVTMGNVLGFSNQPFSVVVWVKTAAGYSIPDSEVFSKHVGFSHNGYWMLLNQTGGGGQVGKALFGEGTAARSVISTTTVNDGNWHQIVSTFQPGTSLSIYVDGAPAENVAIASASLIPNTAPFLIGGVLLASPEGRYTGLVDEMQVYNHALTADQVQFLFTNPTSIVPTNCADLLAAANAQIAQLQGELATANAQILTASQALQVLTLDFQHTFNNPQFEIPGDNWAEQVESLVLGIGETPRGHRRGLYNNLLRDPTAE